MKLQFIALSACLVAGSATAQKSNTLPKLNPPGQLQVPVETLPDTLEVLRPTQKRAAGCIKHQVYNAPSPDRISVGFVLNTSSGDQTFNFEADAIRYIPDGAGVPLASAAQTDRWDRVLDTLERAAAADKPLLIDYTMPDRKVFGMYILWEGTCSAG